MIRHRYRRIVFFFARVLISFILCDLILPRFGFRRWSERTRPARLQRAAHAYRLLAVEMGGVLIKVGQFLSARVDVLPTEVTAELAGLQDEVPAETFEDIRRLAEDEFGRPLSEMYLHFEEQPLAAASLGQVHRAWLNPASLAVASPSPDLPHAAQADDPSSALPSPSPDHQAEVVVKVQRPNIEILIATDLAALRTVGRWLHRYRPIRRRANIPLLLEEFTRILYEEIDYLAEGRNAEIFADIFRNDPGVRVPRVVWSHTTQRVLTLENVWNIKISDYDAITNAGIDRREVATRLLNTYLRQIFEEGFFHADPHPGNLFVEPLPPGEDGRVPWRLTFVDFGMVGHLPAAMKDGLREMLIAVGTRDAHRLIGAYQQLGILLPEADLKLLEEASAMAFDRFWGKSMSDLQHLSMSEMTQFAIQFRQLLYTLPFQIPQDFIFLARCVGILSGMCTGLDADFNVWEHLAPYAQKLIAEEVRSNRLYWLDELKRLARVVLLLPLRLDSLLTRIERGELTLRTSQVDVQSHHLEVALHQATIGVILAALLLGGIQLFMGGYTWLAALFLAGSVVAFLWLLIARRPH